MITLDLPPSIEQAIISEAHAQDLSVSEYILRHLPTQSMPTKSLVERFSQSNPKVADIELELIPRQLSPQHRLEIFD